MNAITIGRGPRCDVVVTDDEYVSLIHVQIALAANGWVLADMSTNGTRIIRDGVRYSVKPGQLWMLRPGDVIRVGRTELPPWNPTVGPTVNPTETPR